MAENKRAEGWKTDRNDLSGSDPLADLARIIGYDKGRERSESVSGDFSVSEAAAPSNVPAMADLEDELLREFALYDNPDYEASETPAAPPKISAVEPAEAASAQEAELDLSDFEDELSAALESHEDTPAEEPVLAAGAEAALETDSEPDFDFEISEIDLSEDEAEATSPQAAAETPVAVHLSESALQADAKADEEDDGTMPPLGFADDLLAAAENEVAEEELSAPEVSVEAPDEDEQDIAFAGPVPGLEEFEESRADQADDASAPEASVEAEPVLAGPVPDLDGAGDESEVEFSGPVPEFDLEADAEFTGPIPDLDFGSDTAFSGPVPDFDFGADSEFAGPVPDLDFGGDEADSTDADGNAALSGVSLEEELELSLGALDLKPEDAEPHSAFAEWKSERLAGLAVAHEPMEPVWVPKPVLAAPIPEPDPVEKKKDFEPETGLTEAQEASVEAQKPENVSEISIAEEASAPVDEAVVEDAAAVPDVDEDVQVAEASDDVADSTEPPELDFELDEATLAGLVPWSFDEAPAVENEGEGTAETPEQVEKEVPSAPAETAVDETVLPIFLSVASQPEAKTEPEPTPNESLEPADLLDDFEFHLDEAEFEAEMSRAVMSELDVSDIGTTTPQAGELKAETSQPAFVPPPSPKELPFNPEQIASLDDGPAPMRALDVPKLPEPEDEPEGKVSDFDYDIEAEMASLFGVGENTGALHELEETAIEKPDAATGDDELGQQSGDVDADLEDEFLKAFHQPLENPANLAHKQPLNMADNTAGSRRGLYLRTAAALVAVAVIGTIAAYIFVPGDVEKVVEDGKPEVILADKTPIKVRPKDPGGKKVPNQDKAVYDKVSGQDTALKQERLISGEEAPVNVNEQTLGADQAANEGVVADGSQADNKSDARLAGDQNQGSNTDILPPRKVKTMIVLPDGTLVARDDANTDASSAGGSQTPAQAGASNDVAAVLKSGETGNATDQALADAANATVAQTAAPAVDVPVPTPRPAAPATASNQTAAATPAPAPAPKSQASSQPAATPVASSANLAPGTYVVQIASLPSEAEAKRSYANLSRKFSSVIGGHAVDIKRADIAGKGTYYRVRIVAGTRAQAVALCQSYKAAGGSCLVSR